MKGFEEWVCLDCNHRWEVLENCPPDACEHCGSEAIEPAYDEVAAADLFADADQAETDEDAEQAEQDRAGRA